MKSIDVLVFDLDGTLIQRQDAIVKSLRDSFGITPSRSQREQIVALDQNGYSSRLELMQYVRGQFNLRLSSEEMWSQMQTTIGKYVHIDGEVIPSLKQLASKFELAILSNGGSVTQRTKLLSTGLNTIFSENHIFISEEIGKSKPNPEVFDFVQRHFIHKSLCMIGDHYVNDIEGASACGWATILFSENRSNQGGVEVDNIRKLVDILC